MTWINIEPSGDGVRVAIDGWGVGVTFRDEASARRAVSAILAEAVRPADDVVKVRVTA